MDINAVRADLYALLAEGFKMPSQEFVTEWRSSELAAFLYQSFRSLQYDIPNAYYDRWPQLIKELSQQRIDYHDSLEGNRFLPVESIYRQWTYDETAEVAFAKEKGYLMSDAALHMMALYEQYGLAMPEEFTGKPDHLCLELEFMAFLVEHEDIEKQAVFLHEHLDWLDECYQDAVAKGVTGFYAKLLKLVAEFIRCERMRLEARTKTRGK